MVVDGYDTEDFDRIFALFMDLFISSLTKGLASVEFTQRLNQGLMLQSDREQVVENFYSAVKSQMNDAQPLPVLDMILETEFNEVLSRFTPTKEQIREMVVIKRCIKFLVTADLDSFLNTSNMWSVRTDRYAASEFFPTLSALNKWSCTPYVAKTSTREPSSD